MNSKEKVASIVLIQIILIVSSFLILVYIESEWLIIGNSINNSGLNRFLAANVMLDLYSAEKYYPHYDYMSPLESLKENILLLKNGGTNSVQTIKSIPDELLPFWNTVYSDYENFENSVSLHLSSEGNAFEHNSELALNYESLLKSSDRLTFEYASFLEKIDVLLIQLQLILLFINSIAHVFLILVIFRILNKESEEKMKLDKFATIGKFGASISHDLKNPLTVIKGSIDLLKLKKEKTLSELEEKQFSKISKSVDDIEYLTNDILDFTRSTKLNLQEIGLLKIIQSSIDESVIPERIKLQIPKNDSKIKVDKIKIQSVISNLIKNSIDSINDDGVISIEITDGTDGVLLTVTDTGSGMSSDVKSRIFEPLFTTKIHGTGLGLANCKRIIEQHGGTIEVLSNPTRFFIHLPKQ